MNEECPECGEELEDSADFHCMATLTAASAVTTIIISESRRLTMTEPTSGWSEYDAATAKVLAGAMDRTIARSSDRVKAACGVSAGHDGVDVLALCNAEPRITRDGFGHQIVAIPLWKWKEFAPAVATLIARNADLKSDNDAAISIIHEEIAKFIDVRAAGGALASEDTPTFCARLVAERDALIVRNAELDAERTILIDERDQLNSDYLTAINAANAIAAKNKSLREALIDVRDNVRGDSPEMWARVDAAIAMRESRSDG